MRFFLRCDEATVDNSVYHVIERGYFFANILEFDFFDQHDLALLDRIDIETGRLAESRDSLVTGPPFSIAKAIICSIPFSSTE